MNEKDPRIMMLYNDAYHFHLIHNGYSVNSASLKLKKIIFYNR